MPRRRAKLSGAIVLLIALLALAAYNIKPTTSVRAFNGAPSKIVEIFEVYPGGGNASATYTNDYVQLVNVSQSSVDISGWSIQYQSSAATTWTIVNICSSTTPGTCVLASGRNYLIQLASGGANGVALPVAANITNGSLNMAAAQAKLALVNSTTTLPATSAGNCSTVLPILGSPAVIDFVSWGTNTNPCSETSPATGSLANTQSLTRTSLVDTDNNSTDFAINASPVPENAASSPVTPTAPNTLISGQVTTRDGSPLGGVIVTLSGSRTARAITDSNGRYSFEDLDTGNFYSVSPSIANYSFTPLERSFSLLANKTDAVFTATPNAIETGNPLDTAEFFVRQQYLDFLGREPDQGGLAFWSGKISACGGDSTCVREAHDNVSAAFFMSDEFQERGFFVYRMTRAALDGMPDYSRFTQDSHAIATGAGLEASREAFAESFVQQPEFIQKYPQGLSGSEFVDSLLQSVELNSGVDLSSQRSALIDDFNSNGSRARVLRMVAENSPFSNAEYNRAFVLMEYFGYLHRNPDSTGYNFWLEVLNNRVPGNFRSMVCAFLSSSEYQRRFSSVVTRSNSECSQ
ncbi:MAG TPA: DUF4214 domain-containing protein [Pyrinomonadaceae bacterium]|nr:DUF4214 domain-containing protein [Pyrinomonadaceae bacterium]